MFPLTDPVLVFTVLISVILAALLLAPRVRVPDLVLLLLAGALLGEHGFAVLERSEAIKLFGAVGLIYIMFLAGLEIDLYQFARTRNRSIGFGLITFLIPQVFGTLAAWALLGLSWPAALLMASMFASHTLLAYPVASRLGIHRSEAVTVTVGATIITDTLALLVLAVVVDASKGIVMDLNFWLMLSAAMSLLVATITLLIPRLARWFFRNVTESGGAQFLFVLSVVCACAYLSHFARMEPIIGAFLAGAAFNRLVPEHSPLMNRLVFAGETLFIPIFLISVGMLVDPSALVGSVRTWQVMGLMVAAVVITKFLAAQIAGRLFRYSRPEKQVMFGLSVVQAAATLAAVLVGFQAGILDKDALNGAIAMILVTVPLGSWMVERNGRRMALQQTAPRRTSRATEQRLLIPVAHPSSAARMMELAFLLRDKAVAGALFPLTIVRDEGGAEEAITRGEKLLAKCMTHASAADMNVEPHVRVDLNPADGICRAARELRASTVLVGWGEEATRAARLFGSVNQNLSEICPCRLLICRIQRPPATNKVLRVPFPPLSEHREDLLQLLREIRLLARQMGVDLHVYLAGKASDGLRKAIENAQPSGKTQFHVAETWAGARQLLFDHLGVNDFLLLPQIRRNTLLWTPTLDRLPALIAQRFADINFIVAYPAIPSDDESASAPIVVSSDGGFPSLRAVDFPGALTAEASIQFLLRNGMSDDPGMALAAAPALLDSARFNPVELAPGVILLHAHSGDRESPVLLVGCGKGQGRFFELPECPRVLMALISPKGDAPEIHLRSLAAVARRFRKPETAAAIADADSAETLCSLLTAPAEPKVPSGFDKPL